MCPSDTLSEFRHLSAIFTLLFNEAMAFTFNQKPVIFDKHDDKGCLICPSCGNGSGGSLHQTEVTAYFRREDAVKGATVRVNDKLNAYTGTDQTGNPSERRDGVSITFMCECCNAHPVLNIVQHKGCSYTYWTNAEPAVYLAAAILAGEEFNSTCSPDDF
jgi:hypothetical protein